MSEQAPSAEEAIHGTLAGISPEPEEDEAAAIAVAVTLAMSASAPEPAVRSIPRWRFSGPCPGERAAAELSRTEAARRPIDLDAEADAVVDRLWGLGEELQQADPARLRELLRRMVERIELRFKHVPKGKRVECPLTGGEIRLHPEFFCSVNRGDRI